MLAYIMDKSVFIFGINVYLYSLLFLSYPLDIMTVFYLSSVSYSLLWYVPNLPIALPTTHHTTPLGIR